MTRTNDEFLAVLAQVGVDTGAELAGFLADADRFEADLIDYLLGDPADDDAGADLSRAQAVTSRATAKGWDTVGEKINEADGTVENPDL